MIHRLLIPAFQVPRRRDVFLEGVADRRHIIYRLYHRPTGLVMQLVFAQGSQAPPYTEIARALFDQLHDALIDFHTEPYFAPVA